MAESFPGCRYATVSVGQRIRTQPVCERALFSRNAGLLAFHNFFLNILLHRHFFFSLTFFFDKVIGFSFHVTFHSCFSRTCRRRQSGDRGPSGPSGPGGTSGPGSTSGPGGTSGSRTASFRRHFGLKIGGKILGVVQHLHHHVFRLLSRFLLGFSDCTTHPQGLVFTTNCLLFEEMRFVS